MTDDERRRALEAWTDESIRAIKDWGNRAEALEPIDPLLAGLADSIAKMSRAFTSRAIEVLNRDEK